MPSGDIPERGDAVRISLNPKACHEQMGRRPAVVLSPAAYNRKAGLAVICPITNQIKGYPFEVLIPEGAPVSGAVLADHVKSQDWKARKCERISRLSDRVVDEVLAKVRALL
jgi:mRNA interferase MazF